MSNSKPNQLTFAHWRDHAVVREVAPTLEPVGHTLHSYFVSSPESPDGKSVLLFHSTDPEGHVGDVVIVDRNSGTSRTIAPNVTCEDAHRQAYQQWLDGGRTIVYQDLIKGRWQVFAVDVPSGEQRVIATDCQLGYGAANGNVAPLHALHWQPGDCRDLQLFDLHSSEMRTPLTVSRVIETYPNWAKQTFDNPAHCSIFFPVISPDGNRVFFKLSEPMEGTFRSPNASKRSGLIVYDLANDRLLMQRDNWGHPAWHSDSRTIITPQNVLIDSDTGAERVIANLPEFPGSHPNLHPTTSLGVTDCYMRGENIPAGWWAVSLFDIESGNTTNLHEVRELPGPPTSWRPPHPHPVFNRAGDRLYFNVMQGKHARLHVASINESQ